MLTFVALVITFLWIVYFYQQKIFSFFCFFSFVSSLCFSYWLTDELIFQRQIDPKVSFMLIDPNSVVYCFVYLFSICRFTFSILFFFFLTFNTLKAFFYKEEFRFFCSLSAFIVFIFILSFVIIVHDISNTFLLKIPSGRSDRTESVYYYKTRSWEFSLYFFHFFGVFFDFVTTFISLYLFFAFFWWFKGNFCIEMNKDTLKNISINRYFQQIATDTHIIYNIKQKILFTWIIRGCIFFTSFYFFSGEFFIFDMTRLFITFFWTELFFMLTYLVYQIVRYNLIHSHYELKALNLLEIYYFFSKFQNILYFFLINTGWNL